MAAASSNHGMGRSGRSTGPEQAAARLPGPVPGPVPSRRPQADAHDHSHSDGHGNLIGRLLMQPAAAPPRLLVSARRRGASRPAIYSDCSVLEEHTVVSTLLFLKHTIDKISSQFYCSFGRSTLPSIYPISFQVSSFYPIIFRKQIP